MLDKWLFLVMLVSFTQPAFASEKVKKIPLICYNCSVTTSGKSEECTGSFNQVVINLKRETIFFQTLDSEKGGVLSSVSVSGDGTTCTIVDEYNWQCEMQETDSTGLTNYFDASMTETKFVMRQILFGDNDPLPLFTKMCGHLDQ